MNLDLLESCCLSGVMPQDVVLVASCVTLSEQELKKTFPNIKVFFSLENYAQGNRTAAWEALEPVLKEHEAHGKACLHVLEPSADDYALYARLRSASWLWGGLRYEALPHVGIPSTAFYGDEFKEDVLRLATVEGSLPYSRACVLWFTDTKHQDLPQNVYLVTGNDWHGWRARHPLGVAPCTFSPGFPEELRGAIEKAVSVEPGSTAGHVEDATARYAEPRTSTQLSVLMPSSYHSNVIKHVYADCRRAFQELGHLPQVLEEQNESQLILGHHIAEAVKNQLPDLVVFIDHLRYETRAFPSRLPVATWIQDDLPPLRDRKYVDQVTEHDYIFAYSSEACKRYMGYGYPRVDLLPMGVNPDRFDFEPGPGNGQIAITANLQEQTLAPQAVAWMHANVQRPHGLLLLEPQKLTTLIIADLNLRTKRTERAGIEYHVWHWLRQQNIFDHIDILTGIGVPIALYGNGWQGSKYEKLCLGPVGPKDLPQVYRKHSAVLTPANNLLLHPRVLETFASGGCSIQQNNPGLESLGVEQYRTRGALEQVGLRVLADEAWRQKLIAEGNRQVRDQHTYKHRMQTILARVQA